MGEVHSTAYARIPVHYPDSAGRARLVVAADPVPERAAKAARLGYERWTTDWREALADPAVEAVSITAPNHMHREMALTAAAAGKHFLGEKPLGRLPAETAEIALAVEAAGIGPVWDSTTGTRRPSNAKGRLEAGALGRSDHFRIQFLAGYSANGTAALSSRFSRELAGWASSAISAPMPSTWRSISSGRSRECRRPRDPDPAPPARPPQAAAPLRRRRRRQRARTGGERGLGGRARRARVGRARHDRAQPGDGRRDAR